MYKDTRHVTRTLTVQQPPSKPKTTQLLVRKPSSNSSCFTGTSNTPMHMCMLLCLQPSTQVQGKKQPSREARLIGQYSTAKVKVRCTVAETPHTLCAATCCTCPNTNTAAFRQKLLPCTAATTNDPSIEKKPESKGPTTPRFPTVYSYCCCQSHLDTATPQQHTGNTGGSRQPPPADVHGSSW
jgi:hypothetical protein